MACGGKSFLNKNKKRDNKMMHCTSDLLPVTQNRGIFASFLYILPRVLSDGCRHNVPYSYDETSVRAGAKAMENLMNKRAVTTSGNMLPFSLFSQCLPFEIH